RHVTPRAGLSGGLPETAVRGKEAAGNQREATQATHSVPGVRFPHRAAAAFFAASLSFSLPSFFARAGPPFSPPLLPSATAAGSWPESPRAGGGVAGVSPVASIPCCIMPNAKTAESGVFGLRFFLAMLALSRAACKIQERSRITLPAHERRRQNAGTQ